MQILAVAINVLFGGVSILSPVLIIEDAIQSNRSVIAKQFINTTQYDYYLLPITEASFPIRNWSVEVPIITSRAAVSFDINSDKFLYEKELQLRLPIASLTKIMTAVVVLENLNLDDLIKVSKGAILDSYIPGSSKELIAGEVLRAEDLLKLMLIKSSNEAAFAFKEFAAEQGIDLIFEMNQKAQDLDMVDTYFNDPAGLDDENGFSTAEDLIKLVKYSLSHDIIHSILRTRQETIFSQDRSIVHRIFSTNKLLNLIPNLITGKTGYTEEALGNMAVVTKSRAGGNTISIILGSNQRFEETKELIDWINKAYIWN